MRTLACISASGHRREKSHLAAFTQGLRFAAHGLVECGAHGALPGQGLGMGAPQSDQFIAQLAHGLGRG
jgi:hypothetical protein